MRRLAQLDQTVSPEADQRALRVLADPHAPIGDAAEAYLYLHGRGYRSMKCRSGATYYYKERRKK